MKEDTRDPTTREFEVPLHIWNTAAFQSWYTRLIEAGNRLDGAELLWEFRPALAPSFVFAFCLKVKVWVTKEERYKDNEFILSRPDMSVVVAYCLDPDFDETRILLIEEFRSPCGDLVIECPGGSSFKPDKVPEVVAAQELQQETGLIVDPSRIKRANAPRQIAATWGTHQVHLFSCQLTPEEMDAMEVLEKTGKPFGVVSDTERTYPVVRRLKNILETGADWATLGMVLSVLCVEGED